MASRTRGKTPAKTGNESHKLYFYLLLKKKSRTVPAARRCGGDDGHQTFLCCCRQGWRFLLIFHAVNIVWQCGGKWYEGWNGKGCLHSSVYEGAGLIKNWLLPFYPSNGCHRVRGESGMLHWWGCVGGGLKSEKMEHRLAGFVAVFF